jgi:hypothetical protein
VCLFPGDGGAGGGDKVDERANVIPGGQRVEETCAQDGVAAEFCGGQEAFAAELDVARDLGL